MIKPKDAIRVLVADDHPVVREGVAAMISQQPDMVVCGEAEDGAQCVELWRKTRPDAVLLDLQMGAQGGLQALRAIRSDDPRARVIVLTTSDLAEDVYQSVQAGASAYLLKDAGRTVLLETIRRVHRGEKVLPSAVAAKLADRLISGSLTPRESEVLALVAQGLANKEVAEKLGLSEATVKTHLNGLMQKLNSRSRTEAVTRARERGWLR